MRIASLLSSSTEMLYALGLGPCVVAVSHECDYPPEVREKPRATRTNIAAEAASGQIDAQVRQLVEQGRPLYELDLPLLARLQPDLIVTQAQCDVCAVRYADVLDAVRDTPALRHARVVALNPQSLDDVLADIQRIAEAVDECRPVSPKPAAGFGETRLHYADTYIARLNSRIAAIADRTRLLPSDQRPRVACIEWVEPLMIAGNWTPQLIELAGGQQSLVPGHRHSPYISWEAVRQFDPQVVVIAPCGFDLARTLIESPPLVRLEGWHELTAVREGRVYAVDGNAYFNRSGPRLIDTLEILAHLIHPQLFALPASAASAVRGDLFGPPPCDKMRL